ncbi:MAG: TIGR02266 family protein [bacterium]
MSADGKERRRHPRLPIELKVEYKRLNTFFADYTKNISKGGTFIKTPKALDIGTEFIFQLTVPGLSSPIRLRGRVMWVIREGEDPPPQAEGMTELGMGIRFIYEGDTQRHSINGMVEQLMVDSLGPLLYSKLMQDE